MESESYVIFISLMMRRNVIETGDPSLSAKDVVEGHVGKIKKLDESQKLLVEKIERLMREFASAPAHV